MPEYKKVGYLTTSFKLFHLKDHEQREFSYHYHDFHKILVLLQGDVTYCVEGRSYALLPGDIVLVNAGEVHRPILTSDRVYERMIFYVSPDFLAQYEEPDNDLTLCFKQAARDQSHVLRFESSVSSKLDLNLRAIDQAINDTDYAAPLHQKLLFLEFLLQLNRAAIRGRVEYIHNLASDGKIIDVLKYLEQHLTEDISIQELSEKFFVNRYYLMHSFKEQTGYTIGGYLSTKRLLLAQSLIKHGTPITEVCYACGFKNYSTFSRAYKKGFGESPREFRQSL